MKRSKKMKTVTLMILIALANYMCGCSAVGLGVGTLIDNSVPENKRLEKDQILSVEVGTDMTLYMENGSFDSGRIKGYTSKTPVEPGQVDDEPNLTINEHMLIFKSSVSSDSALQVKYIPMSSVSHAQVRNSRYAKYIGLGIGLLIDISIMNGLNNFFSEPLLGSEE